MAEETLNNHDLASDEIESESLLVLFFMTCLLMSLLARTINQKFQIPYTPQLIVGGIIIGGINIWGHISISASIIHTIHPHGILTIFLPLLIMESSFNAHMSILSVNYVQVLTLIIPAVIITALLLAVSIKSILGYSDEDLDWWGALVLGSILAATDPVAVVALLKELGAPLHISTLIEMESLFNDGTAMVFFNIFYQSFAGKEQTIGDGIVLFFRLSFGGIGLGLAWGIGVIVLLQFFKKGQTLFLHLILLSSYSVFYVGENVCEVSGILAIVACGLVMNKYMKNMMTLGQVHSAEAIVTYLAHIFETMLFFFAGIIIGIQFGDSFTFLEKEDWGYMVALYILVVLVRLVAMIILSPILYYTGEGFNLKELILSVWGGLRGALCIALALVVYTDDELTNERGKILVLFFTCGVAALTLLINGVTAPWVVNEVKLIENISVRQYFKSLFLKSVKKEGQKKLESLKYDQSYSMALWHGVEDIVQFDQIDDERKHINVFKSNIIFRFKEKQKLQIAQHRYQILRHLMKFLIDMQHEQYYYDSVFGQIEEGILESCEQSHKPINIFSRCKRTMGNYDYLLKCYKMPLIGKVFEMLFYHFLDKNFKLLDTLHLILNRTIDLEIKYQRRIPNDFNLLEELHTELLVVTEELQHYRQAYSDELQKLSQQHAAIKVLKVQAHYVDSKINGLVAEKEGSYLRNKILDQLTSVGNIFTPLSLQGGKDLIIHTTFQGLLEEQDILYMCQHQQIEHFKPHEEIVTKQDPHMYVILSGEVEERVYKNESDYVTLIYGNNNVVGIANSIDKNLQISIVSLTDVEVLRVNIHVDVNSRFKKFCYRKSLPSFLKLYCEESFIQKMSTLQLNQIAQHSEILIDTSSCVAEQGGLIFHGTFNRVDNNQKYVGPKILEPMNIMLKGGEDQTAIALFRDTLVRIIANRRFSSIPVGYTKRERRGSQADKLL